MDANTTEVAAAEMRIAQHRDNAARAKAELAVTLDELKAAQDQLLVKRLDDAIEEQRKVEQEALAYSKNVNSLYQRAVKWKADQKRFQSSLKELDQFAKWAVATEHDLHAIAGNLEYVWAVLEKEQETMVNSGHAQAQSSST
ncbi:hypothetical protein CCR75_008326 [Bremia lactucae]|uniref:Biogenesis of lysosome-related organelles complex 1 subunit 1 n=1 Tax=Bremia lactucae TaxID=4779 RepID=A0A976FJ28_BRELC|nr:hypothetical protein CCR75_008326 [Bremia lactucae]